MSTSKIRKLALGVGIVVAIIIINAEIFLNSRPKADIAETNKQIACLNLLKQIAIQDDDFNRLNLLNQVLSHCPTTCDSEIRSQFTTLQSSKLDESAKSRRREERKAYITLIFQNGTCKFK